MLLTIDVGNTNIVLGVFDGATIVHSWRLATLRRVQRFMARERVRWITVAEVGKVRGCSVSALRQAIRLGLLRPPRLRWSETSGHLLRVWLRSYICGKAGPPT